MSTQEDPRQLVAELDAIESRVRQYRSLCVRMVGYASQPVHEVELIDQVPVRSGSIMKFLGRQETSNRNVRTQIATLDANERRALAEALREMADKEVVKAKKLAARIGTTTKVN